MFESLRRYIHFALFTESGRQSLRDVKLAFTGVAQRLARVAHNHEVIRSKRISGISHHIASVHHGTSAFNTPLAQRQERQAHNLEVTRSKLVGGIFTLPGFQNQVVNYYATLN